MKRGSKRIIEAAILLFLVLGVVLLTGRIREEQPAVTEEESAEEVSEPRQVGPVKPVILPKKPEPETAAYEPPVDFEALAAVNPEVIGWIRIDDTHIDYPIVYRNDYDYYLHHDIDGNETAAGSIFLDMEDKTDMTSRHNVIYGHRMKDGSMFKDVIRFREEQFFKEHPYYTIYLPDREIRLKVISCYYAPNSYQLRRMYFPTQRAFDKFVERSLEKCPYAAEVEYPVKSLFTLITCSYEVDDARTMLLAVEVDGDGNQILAETAAGGQTETH